MVCSELVTKAFLPESESDEGLDISLFSIGGSITFPPNELIQLSRNNYGTSRQLLAPVIFIDALEKEKRSFLREPLEVLNT